MVQLQTANFVLVEGVNIYTTLYDTSQLSVIRGGSFLLKEMVKTIEAEFYQLEAVSTGASQGLFKIKSPLDEPEQIVKAIQQRLNEDENYKHFTVMVATAQATSVQDAEIKLAAKIRWLQQQSPTLVPDEKPSEGFAAEPCDLEGRRAKPATAKTLTIKGSKRRVAESVAARFCDGRSRRRHFYANEISSHNVALPTLLSNPNITFADHFKELSANPDLKLDGKIAVLYVDGNSFGSKLKACLQAAQQQASPERSVDTTVECQQQVDTQLQTQRAQFLANLLDSFFESAQIKAPASAMFPYAIDPYDEMVKVETLLWGGDEMMFVVPAWLGWDLVQFFYQQSQDWQMPFSPLEQNLTHAGGIVFCSHKTPIPLVQKLAYDLAERVKDQVNGRKHNGFDYVVLEAIDYPTESDLDVFFQQLYGKFGSLANTEQNRYQAYRLPLNPVANWPQLKVALSELMDSGLLARSQLYRLVQQTVDRSRQCQSSTAELDAFLGTDELCWQQICAQYKEAELTSVKRTSQDVISYPEFVNLEMRLLQVSEQPSKLIEQINQTIFPVFNTDPDSPISRAATWLHLVELWDYLVPQLKKKG